MLLSNLADGKQTRGGMMRLRDRSAAMRVALVGPVQSGKSSLFEAVARAGGSHLDLSRPDQPHLAVVKVPDPRLDWLAEQYKSKKVTHAELEFLDLPGFDLSDEAGRARAKTHWTDMRQSQMLVFVLREFASDAAAAYRGRVDPQADAKELLEEMRFADLEQVAGRIDKLEAALRKPAGKREEQQRELDLMKRMAAALEGGGAVRHAIASEAEWKLLGGFGFLSAKPALVVLNCSEDDAAKPGPSEFASLPCVRLATKLEAELSCLGEQDRKEFQAELGLRAAACDLLVGACLRRMNLASFFTANANECRAWIASAGADAITAAGMVHSDIARGFIRAEVVHYEDYRAAGDHKAAKAAGKVRLEGKEYVVRDGDVIYFRFNV